MSLKHIIVVLYDDKMFSKPHFDFNSYLDYEVEYLPFYNIKNTFEKLLDIHVENFPETWDTIPKFHKHYTHHCKIAYEYENKKFNLKF